MRLIFASYPARSFADQYLVNPNVTPGSSTPS